MKIFICKNSKQIIISQNAKKMIINKEDKLYDELYPLSKEEIKTWYLGRR